MRHGIVIIGSGFAARQLVKNIRKNDITVPLTLIAADSADEYNKPDLSHVMSRGVRADDMTRQRATDFARQFNVRLFPDTLVSDIDIGQRTIKSLGAEWPYDDLVLATGAAAALPAVPGCEHLLTLNSQQEYRAVEGRLRDTRRVVILGGGLIGCELAMDFCRAGKQVTVVDRAAALLSSLMPPEVSARLHHRLSDMGVDIVLGQSLSQLRRDETGLVVALSGGRCIQVDEAISAIGLRAVTELAQRADLVINQGIVVDATLKTSQAHVYALGDCAEINGRLRPFLQPIQLSAMVLAKNLTGQPTTLTLPPMLVTLKTPECPLQLAGDIHCVHEWQMVASAQGMVAKGYDVAKKLRAFVVSELQTPQAFTLLRELAAS